MDADRVDTLSRALNNRSRRGAVQALGALGVVGLTSRLSATTEAKKKKKKKKDCPTCPTCPDATTCPACAAGLELRQNGTCARKTSSSANCLTGAGCVLSGTSIDDGVSRYCVANANGSACTNLTQGCTSTAQCSKGSICVDAGCAAGFPIRCMAVCGA